MPRRLLNYGGLIDPIADRLVADPAAGTKAGARGGEKLVRRSGPFSGVERAPAIAGLGAMGAFPPPRGGGHSIRPPGSRGVPARAACRGRRAFIPRISPG